MKVDHIGIAVKSTSEAMKIYESLGLKFRGVEVLENEEVKIASFDAEGSRIELIEPLYPDSVIAKFIEAKGEGIHHLAFRVGSLEKTLKMLEEIGIKPIGEGIRNGAEGSKISFLHPKNFKGVLIELVERHSP